jgi:hypothetical protein
MGSKPADITTYDGTRKNMQSENLMGILKIGTVYFSVIRNRRKVPWIKCNGIVPSFLQSNM